MTAGVHEALFESVATLDEIGLRYAVVGGLAVSAWSVPRATRDVDLYAELPLGVRAKLETALTERGFDVPAMAAELERFGVFRSKLRRSGVFLDIFDATGPLGESILDRRVKLTVQGREIWFVSAEDLAVLKAFSDRPRDSDDLVALLAVPYDTLDLAYIERWVKLLDESIGGNDVSERLAQARRHADRRRRGPDQ
jgi:predicted nucleotidyltransferase